MKKIIDFFKKVKLFFQEELWIKDTAALPTLRKMLFAVSRIIMIVIRGFNQDNCTLQASALTYITLVSLVPILAIMFSFTKGLGMQKKLFTAVGVERIRIIDPETGKRSFDYRIIAPKENANEQPTVQTTPTANTQDPSEQHNEEDSEHDDKILTAGMASKLPQPMQEALIKIFQYVENTNFTALGLIGSIMLLFSVICSMAKLENSFNLIWGVRQPRNFLRKCSEYLVVLILIPIIFLLTTSLNSLIFSNKFIMYLQENYGQVAYVISALVKIISLLVLLASFGLFFMYMPNTKVKPIPAFVAGTISFLLWGAVQWAYLRLQVGLTNFNSIYGTFAVVPFFLAWLYANWSIILLGGELSFAIQNHRTIHIEKAAERTSTGTCIVIGQLILFEVCSNFANGKGATDINEFALNRSIPTRFTRYVTDTLTKAGILVRTAATNVESYLPGKDISLLSPADVEEAFRQQNSLDTRSYIRDLPEELRNGYESVYDAYKAKLSTLTFNKIIHDKTLPQNTQTK